MGFQKPRQLTDSVATPSHERRPMPISSYLLPRRRQQLKLGLVDWMILGSHQSCQIFTKWQLQFSSSVPPRQQRKLLILVIIGSPDFLIGILALRNDMQPILRMGEQLLGSQKPYIPSSIGLLKFGADTISDLKTLIMQMKRGLQLGKDTSKVRFQYAVYGRHLASDSQAIENGCQPLSVFLRQVRYCLYTLSIKASHT